MDADAIEAVLIFDSDEEMAKWLKSYANLMALKVQYSPTKHRAILNKGARQITILKGRK